MTLEIRFSNREGNDYPFEVVVSFQGVVVGIYSYPTRARAYHALPAIAWELEDGGMNGFQF